MRARIRGCPKCSGYLYVEQDADGRRTLAPEWVCLQCGWRGRIEARAGREIAQNANR
jgi:RNase P subunit RPR2